MAEERIYDDIKEELSKFSAQFGPTVIVPGDVKNIGEDDTVSVELDNGVVETARLKSVLKDGNKFIVVPKENSRVQIAKIENRDVYIVIAVEEINRIYGKIGTVEIEITEDKIILKKGDDSFAKIISDFMDEVNKIVVMYGTTPNVAAITAIKERLNLMSE